MYAAALALIEGERLPHPQYVMPVRPLVDAQPWLLPETRPQPRPASEINTSTT